MFSLEYASASVEVGGPAASTSLTSDATVEDAAAVTACPGRMPPAIRVPAEVLTRIAPPPQVFLSKRVPSVSGRLTAATLLPEKVLLVKTLPAGRPPVEVAVSGMSEPL